jgi:hypothetical protein
MTGTEVRVIVFLAIVIRLSVMWCLRVPRDHKSTSATSPGPTNVAKDIQLSSKTSRKDYTVWSERMNPCCRQAS